jgi:hypothetical protein
MSGLNYPDHFYADALRPQKPAGAYDAAKLCEETIAIAGSQDRADPVTKPAHYQRAGIETIDYIRATLDGGGFEGYCIGNVLKYVSRYREKGGVEDLRKAQVYLGWAISPNRDTTPSGYDAALADISDATKPPKWSPDWVAPSPHGLVAHDIRAPHPMAAEALRDHDTAYLTGFLPNGPGGGL